MFKQPKIKPADSDILGVLKVPYYHKLTSVMFSHNNLCLGPVNVNSPEMKDVHPLLFKAAISQKQLELSTVAQ